MHFSLCKIFYKRITVYARLLFENEIENPVCKRKFVYGVNIIRFRKVGGFYNRNVFNVFFGGKLLFLHGSPHFGRFFA